jgi:hypothetical protein
MVGHETHRQPPPFYRQWIANPRRCFTKPLVMVQLIQPHHFMSWKSAKFRKRHRQHFLRWKYTTAANLSQAKMWRSRRPREALSGLLP